MIEKLRRRGGGRSICDVQVGTWCCLNMFNAMQSWPALSANSGSCGLPLGSNLIFFSCTDAYLHTRTPASTRFCGLSGTFRGKDSPAASSVSLMKCTTATPAQVRVHATDMPYRLDGAVRRVGRVGSTRSKGRLQVWTGCPTRPHAQQHPEYSSLPPPATQTASHRTAGHVTTFPPGSARTTNKPGYRPQHLHASRADATGDGAAVSSRCSCQVMPYRCLLVCSLHAWPALRQRSE